MKTRSQYVDDAVQQILDEFDEQVGNNDISIGDRAAIARIVAKAIAPAALYLTSEAAKAVHPTNPELELSPPARFRLDMLRELTPDPREGHA